MKINQIIQEKRKALNMTQEQIANLLNVSVPAVSKWESGTSYPDITILPILARILKTDLNTLLSFQDDLSNEEVDEFVDYLDELVQNKCYELAFQTGMEKIKEYPNCEYLLYLVTIYLDGALILYNVKNQGKYKNHFEQIYNRLLSSDNQEIRENSIRMLISNYVKQKNYKEAEKFITNLTISNIDKEEELALLYTTQKKYNDALILWERRIIQSITQIQTSLLNMASIALEENRKDDMNYFINFYKKVTKDFDFPEWMIYNIELSFIDNFENHNKIINLLKNMFPSMEEEWNMESSPLYKHIGKENQVSSFLTKKLINTICTEFLENEEYKTLRENPEFKILIKKYMNK